MTLAAANEQGLISSRHPCSSKKPERAALQSARTLRGGKRKDADPSQAGSCSFTSSAQTLAPSVTFSALNFTAASSTLSALVECCCPSAMASSPVHSALFLCAFLQLFSLPGGHVPNCQEVRTVFQSLHPGSKWVPETPVSGNSLIKLVDTGR